ncbi:hypothetical protein Tco_0974033 [Tanacetum coccineum]|uniref:NLP1-9 GAF domain-containing protein n=1 Tax=Tanacetum coccineum TaxID=301880 RepID=A0ABQ5EAH2_9ASTR
MVHEAKIQRDKDKLSSFVKSFPIEIDSIATELCPDRRVFWTPSSSSDDNVLVTKIICAFCNVNVVRFKGLIQFWAPVKTREKVLLSTSIQPFSLENFDPRPHKYRLFCINNKVHIEKDISNGPQAMAFLNRFPQVVLDLRVHKGSPLVDKALDCGFTSVILLPVFYQNNCVGVVECCMNLTGLVEFFNELKLALERAGLSMYLVQKCLPEKCLKRAKEEIEDALKIICESHHLSLAQVWISTIANYTSSLEGTKSQNTMQMFAVKLCGYCADLDNDDDDKYIKTYYDTCDVLPLEMGEGLIGLTLEDTHITEPRFCTNPLKVGTKSFLGLLCSSTNCICLVICLRTQGDDVHYAFEFLWPKSRNYLTVLESLFSTLKRCLPTFMYSSGAQLSDDELRVLDVDNSTGSGLGSFNIFERIRLSQPHKQVIQEWQMPKLVKRKLNDLCESGIDFDSESEYWDGYDDDDIVIYLECTGKRITTMLQSSYTLANALEKVEDSFNLDRGTYTLEYQVDKVGEKGIMLDSDESLISCIKLWRSSQKISGQNIPFRVQVLPSTRADRELKDNMVIAILNLKGEGDVLHTVRVEYEQEPPTCGLCMFFGHDDMTCLKQVVVEPKKQSGKNNDGVQQAFKRDMNSETSRHELSISNPFDALKTVDNDDELGANGGISKTADNVANPNMAATSLGTNRDVYDSIEGEISKMI